MKMKFTTAAVVLMAGVAGLLSSCKQEQSSYTMDSLQGTATITGVVKYNPGYQEVASGESVLDGYYVPVEGVTVNVNVPYSSLGISGSGSKAYSATTDASGRYEIQLPMSASATSINNVEVTVESFYKTYNLYQKGSQETQFVVIPIDDALYNVKNKQNVNANRNNVNVVEDLLCDAEYEIDAEYAGVATITGEVTYYPGYWIDSSGTPKESEDRAAIGAEVSASVTIGNEQRTFTTTVSSNGTYKLSIPVSVKSSTSSVNLSVKSYVAPYNDYEYDTQSRKYVIVTDEYHTYSGKNEYVTAVRDGEVEQVFVLGSY